MQELAAAPPRAEDRPYWVLLNMVPGIGPTRFQRLVALCGDARRAWQASDTELASAGIERRSIAQLRELRRSVDAAAVMARLERLGLTVLLAPDEDYPAPLRQISDPPPVLFVRGCLLPRDVLAVSLVGTRRATSYGKAVAETLARDLALAGVTVVSGLARGIDTAAHRAAIEAGGRTVAVLGNGLDQVYPPQNAQLAKRMVDEQAGALISEFAPGVPPDAVNFPRRNRIIAGMCLATVIVEAGERSGALITADFALEQGREVFAVPGNIVSPMSVGPNNLLKQGAAPVTGVQDILDALGIEHAAAGVDRTPPSVTADEATVLAALGPEPRHADELARELGRNSGELAAILTLLELKGVARQVGSMAYIRAI